LISSVVGSKPKFDFMVGIDDRRVVLIDLGEESHLGQKTESFDEVLKFIRTA